VKPKDIDWGILRGAIIILVISLAASGTLVGGSFYFQNQMERQFARGNAQFQNISRRYLAVDEEEKQINLYYPRFLALYKNGVIGEEQRLNWIEVLRRTGDEIKLPSLNYEIKSQTVFVPQFSAKTGRFQIFHSGMSINANLVHEVDLLRVFEFLNRHAAGVYSVQGCKISRTSEQVDLVAVRGNISARCDINWFTIRLADGKDLKV